MAFGNWDIFGDMARLRRDLDRFSESVRSGRHVADEEQIWAPPVDIHEEDEALVLFVDLPGLKREDIDVEIHEDSLTLQGVRDRPDDGSRIRLERPMGRFRRSFRIGIPVEPASVHATYRDGVLRIRLPRARPTGPSRARVDVK